MPNRIFTDIIRTIADEMDRRSRHDDEVIVRKNHKNSVKTFYSDNHRHLTCYVNLGDDIIKDYKLIADEIQLAVSKILENHMPIIDVSNTAPSTNVEIQLANSGPVSNT